MTAQLRNQSREAVTKKFTGHEGDGGDNPGTKYDLDYISSWQSRFLSVDPAPGDPKNPQSWNRYAYVLGNPLVLNDPTGTTVNLASISDADDRQQLIEQLEQMTGFDLDYDDESGLLTVEGQILDEDGNQVGSSVARDDLTKAIGSYTAYFSCSASFEGHIAVAHTNPDTNKGALMSMDFKLINRIDPGKNGRLTMGSGMVFFHELNHLFGKTDPAEGMIHLHPWVKGETVTHVDRIRSELGLGATESWGRDSLRGLVLDF